MTHSGSMEVVQGRVYCKQYPLPYMAQGPVHGWGYAYTVGHYGPLLLRSRTSSWNHDVTGIWYFGPIRV